MNWLLEPLQFEFIQRALLVCLLVGFTNGYLSAFVVLRKSALKVGSLAHTLLPGIALAIMVAGLSPGSAFLGALFAALVVGLGSLIVSRSSRLDQDSVLAIFYTSAFAIGIIILTHLNVTQELEHWLFGNILGLSDADLWIAFAISGTALILLTILHRPLSLMLFDPTIAATLGVPVRILHYLLFGLMIVVLISTLQSVGCILAVGLLVAPAATLFLFSNSPSTLFWGGGLIGAFGSCAALFIAYWLDWAPGASIVLMLGLLFILAYIFSPKYGLLKQAVPKTHHE